jgi:hypothetical protein
MGGVLSSLGKADFLDMPIMIAVTTPNTIGAVSDPVAKSETTEATSHGLDWVACGGKSLSQ